MYGFVIRYRPPLAALQGLDCFALSLESNMIAARIS